jgi:hypothetical protein
MTWIRWASAALFGVASCALFPYVMVPGIVVPAVAFAIASLWLGITGSWYRQVYLCVDCKTYSTFKTLSEALLPV